MINFKMLTPAHLVAIMPRAPVCYTPALAASMDEFEIATPARAAAFLAQLAHESAELRRLCENLNYSAEVLRKTWPRRFTPEQANEFAYRPERIANHVYANRMGNGDESSGDGWKYRGRGPIQITGREGYRNTSRALYGDDRLVDNPEPLASIVVGARAAAWWWKTHGLNTLADTGKFDAITKAINGGMTGQKERLEYWARAKTTLGV